MPDHNPTYSLFSQDHHAPPILTTGILTPALLCTFQMGMLQYFSQHNITADKHVSSIVWGLHDPKIQNWYINDTAHINMLVFKAFMDEVRIKWLMDGWEGIIKDSMLKSQQHDTPFDNWLQSLQATAALIVGTYAELDDASLHTHIKSNMNDTHPWVYLKGLSYGCSHKN